MLPSAATAGLEIFANPGDDPEAFLERGSAGLPAADRRILEDPEVRGMLTASYRESARYGIQGFARDLHLYTRPWRIPLQTIETEVHLWHGELDPSTPVAGARYVADRIPGCRARFLPDAGHLVLFRHWEEILGALLAGTGANRLVACRQRVSAHSVRRQHWSLDLPPSNPTGSSTACIGDPSASAQPSTSV